MRLKLLLLLLIIQIWVIPGWSKESRAYSIFGGVVYPQSWNTGFTFGASIKLSQISDHALLTTHIYYWSANKKGKDLYHKNIALSLEINYFFSEFEESFYIGAGLSINHVMWEKFYSDSAANISEVKLDEYDTRIGFVPRCGYILRLGTFSPFIEIRYHFIDHFNTFQAIAGFYIKVN